MESAEAPDGLTELLSEQVRYYRALASEYGETAFPELPLDELVRGGDAMIAALRAFHPTGEVLELACGPGTWTSLLLESATTVTAIDAAPEMLELAASRTGTDEFGFCKLISSPGTPTGAMTSCSSASGFRMSRWSALRLSGRWSNDASNQPDAWHSPMTDTERRTS